MAKVALLGFGVVGSGVAEVLKENRETIARRVGEEVELKYILVRRDFPGSPFGPLMVRDFGEIETDRSVDVVYPDNRWGFGKLDINGTFETLARL